MWHGFCNPPQAQDPHRAARSTPLRAAGIGCAGQGTTSPGARLAVAYQEGTKMSDGYHACEAPPSSGLRICISVLMALWCGSGCRGVERPEAAPNDVAGELVSASGCKPRDLVASSDAIPSTQDCIEHQYLSEGTKGTLLLRHVNTAFNCCPAYEAITYVRHDTIFIRERETVGACHCLCLYDLDYSIKGLPLGEYRIWVSQEHLSNGDLPLDFAIDLTASTSGSHCVTRDHYPWGSR